MFSLKTIEKRSTIYTTHLIRGRFIMKLEAINHQPKSNMAYALNENTLSITLQTGRDDVQKVELIVGDPFEWYIEDGKYQWGGKTFAHEMMAKTSFTELFDYYNLEVSSTTKRSKYAFLIYSDTDVYFYGCRNLKKVDIKKDDIFVYDLFGYFNFPYINEEDLIDSPKWSENTIWYQIFPDRFNRSINRKGNYLPFNSVTENLTSEMYFGGDLLGVVEKLPYLKDLGITGIYFTPIFKAHSVHKYDTEDYYNIDPSFGTNEDFKLLVDECHKAGIKVMLDAVFNHCGFMHPFFQDVIKYKKKSKYWNCFYIQDEDFIDFELDETGRPKVHTQKPKYRTFAFTPHMPKLNTSDPLMEEYLLDVATYWIKNYDIDGWRLDVSNEVSHSFWRKFKSTVRAVKSDIYILGENWDNSMPWLRGDQMDAVMNYSLSYPIWQYFGKSMEMAKISDNEFVYQINKLLVDYPKPIQNQMFNLLDSHDTMRILSRFEGNVELVKLAYLFIFTFPGSPVIFYGDEIGLSGKDTQDCRRCMIWDKSFQNVELYDFFKKLISLRKSNVFFQSNVLNFLTFEDELLIYEKEKLVIFMNLSDKKKSILIPTKIQHCTVHNLMTKSSELLLDKMIISEYDFIIYQK